MIHTGGYYNIMNAYIQDQNVNILNLRSFQIQKVD